MNELDFLIPFNLQRSDSYRADNVASTLSARDFKSATDLIVSSIDVRILRDGGGISGTLQSKSNGGYSLNYINPIVQTSGVRRLTPTECERLQGFPDNWTASQSDAQRYKQLGNAVCVNVAEWIGKRITEVLS